ncbi:MAG: hypothetical protein IPM38_14340 [Ignavibacteria bacterium]|nr:hypothetical protein [Ignavibacteria bacterium]
MNKIISLKYFFVINTLAVVVSMSGCSEENDIICTAEARAGLNVYVTDFATNQPVTSGVIVTAKDGSYTDTLMNFQGTNGFAGAWERSGIYVITVECAGYVTYVSDSIKVEADVCHVIPQTVNVLLRRE